MKHLYAVIYFILFIGGYIVYLITNTTPKLSYYSFRKLFCYTNGKLNSFIVSLTSVFLPKYKLLQTDGLLGRLTKEEATEISNEIKENGYKIFDKKLDANEINKLLSFAYSTPANIIPKPKNAEAKGLYNNQQLLGTRYQFSETDLLTDKTIQNIVADENFIAIAQEYLGCSPINDIVTMWWSTSYSTQASSEAAQLYHFDMDRFKFLKFFIYLTDVTTDTGPHCYIRGSNGSLPESLREDRRFTDKEISNAYKKEDLVEICGNKGTIIAVDTRGLHKGKPLKQGERLIFQVEFCTDSFGQVFHKTYLNNGIEDSFLKVKKKYTNTFRRFIMNNK